LPFPAAPGPAQYARLGWISGDADIAVSPSHLTYPAAQPAEAIDYCIGSPTVRFDAEVLTTQGSDHLAQLITITLLEPAFTAKIRPARTSVRCPVRSSTRRGTVLSGSVCRQAPHLRRHEVPAVFTCRRLNGLQEPGLMRTEPSMDDICAS
jgi:hypothetical protein